MDGMMRPAERADELKGLWWSLYDPVVVEKCSQQEQDLQGIAVLLGITFSCFKRLKIQYDDIKHECELTKNLLQVAQTDLNRIQGKLNSKNKKPCEHCKVLENQLGAQKKKAHLIEERMRSIARILNVGRTQQVTCNGESPKQSQFAHAYSVVSQILLNDADETTNSESQNHGQENVETTAPKQQKETDNDNRKFSCQNNPYVADAITFKCFDNMTLVPESIVLDKPIVNVIVPETMVDDEDVCADNIQSIQSEKQSTPKKQMVKNKGAEESRSPVINSRLPATTCTVAHGDTTHRSVAVRVRSNALATDTVSPSLLKDDKAVPCETAEKCIQSSGHDKHVGVWVLKPSNDMTSPARCGSKPCARKLSQTKLSLVRLPGKVDVCSAQEFIGGVQHTSTLAVRKQPDEFDEILQKVLKESLEDHKLERENEDIILESPNSSNVKSQQCSFKASHGRNRVGRLDGPKRSNDPDETFLPVSRNCVKRTRMCDSECTEHLLVELGVPTQIAPGLGVVPLQTTVHHDRVRDGGHINKSSNYVYQRDAVRDKIARSKLEGWACEDCRHLYEGLRLTETEKKTLMNECSKHRDKFPMRSTSPSDW